MPAARALIVPALVLLPLALLAPAPTLAGAGGAPGAAAGAHVHLQGIAFHPGEVRILVGEEVTWDNHEAVLHTVTAEDGSFDSGDLLLNDAFGRTFPRAGAFPYFCIYHPAMVGTVRVADPAEAADLVVAALRAEETTPGIETVVEVEVRNLGRNAAEASRVLVAYRYQGEARTIGEADVPALWPGAAARVALTWGTAGKVGDFALEAHADAAGQVPEGDEGNNRGEGLATVLVGGVGGIDLLDPA